jgi:hypothetical protein
MTTTRAETASSQATVPRWGGLTANATGVTAAGGIVFLVAMPLQRAETAEQHRLAITTEGSRNV